tara:strand:+ start:493 stop:732 length:240 start_codon:yes stop_codon:yes gene_type:complete
MYLSHLLAALTYYSCAGVLQPKNPTVFTSIGLTYHQSGNFNRAIENYNHALGLETIQSKVTSDLLEVAIKEWTIRDVPS